jgi:hypothetical protein
MLLSQIQDKPFALCDVSSQAKNSSGRNRRIKPAFPQGNGTRILPKTTRFGRGEIKATLAQNLKLVAACLLHL